MTVKRKTSRSWPCKRWFGRAREGQGGPGGAKGLPLGLALPVKLGRFGTLGGQGALQEVERPVQLLPHRLGPFGSLAGLLEVLDQGGLVGFLGLVP